MASSPSTTALNSSMTSYGEVVEIGLLLSANRANALFALSKRRGQPVAQILRALIDHALSHEDPESFER